MIIIIIIIWLCLRVLLLFGCVYVGVYAAADMSARDRFMLLLHTANKKLRLRDSKSKSAENSNNDAFEPSITSRSRSTTHVHHVTNAAAAAAAAAADEAELPSHSRVVTVRHYPAYQFDANRNAVSLTTDNCKPMRRVARSFESLNSVRTTCVSANCSARSGCTLPLAYRSLNS